MIIQYKIKNKKLNNIFILLDVMDEISIIKRKFVFYRICKTSKCKQNNIPVLSCTEHTQ